MLKIPNFRGVFMRDTLPPKPLQYESGILNLDTSSGEGSHWIAYVKHGKKVKYFDSIGQLRPPLELIKYFKRDGSVEITYNTDRYQKSTYNCGHLCLGFLYSNTN